MAILHSFGTYNRLYRDKVAGWFDAIPGYETGGYTLSFNDGGPAAAPFIGVAICSPKDRYSRRHGRVLATARMMALYGYYPQREVVEGRFGVINIPSIQRVDGLRDRELLCDAARLHAMAVLEEYFPDLVEHRLVDMGPWQMKEDDDE